MNTEAGKSFMSGFNESVLFLLAPTIADMERENPIFKEVVKVGLTPMLSSVWQSWKTLTLSQKYLGLGLSVIALNLGNVSLDVPAFGIIKVIQLRKKLD